MKKRQNMVVVPEVIEPMTYGDLVDGLGELFKRAKKNVVTAAKHRSEDRT